MNTLLSSVVVVEVRITAIDHKLIAFVVTLFNWGRTTCAGSIRILGLIEVTNMQLKVSSPVFNAFSGDQDMERNTGEALICGTYQAGI